MHVDWRENCVRKRASSSESALMLLTLSRREADPNLLDREIRDLARLMEVGVEIT